MKPTKPKSIADLTVEQVNEELRKIVAEQPDFVYNPTGSGVGCRYNQGHRHGPVCDGCLFGQAFQRLGVPQDSRDLKGGSLVVMLWTLRNSNPAPPVWGSIQLLQDKGHAWGSPEIAELIEKL